MIVFRAKRPPPRGAENPFSYRNRIYSNPLFVPHVMKAATLRSRTMPAVVASNPTDILKTAMEYDDYDAAMSIINMPRIDINYKDVNGQSPLYWACNHCQLDLVKAIIAKGADLNPQDDLGRTPFYIATIRGYIEISLFLLETKGVNIHLKDVYHQSPLAYIENRITDWLLSRSHATERGCDLLVQNYNVLANKIKDRIRHDKAQKAMTFMLSSPFISTFTENPIFDRRLIKTVYSFLV